MYILYIYTVIYIYIYIYQLHIYIYIVALAFQKSLGKAIIIVCIGVTAYPLFLCQNPKKSANFQPPPIVVCALYALYLFFCILL